MAHFNTGTVNLTNINFNSKIYGLIPCNFSPASEYLNGKLSVQSINESVNQSITHSLNQSINQSVSQLVSLYLVTQVMIHTVAVATRNYSYLSFKLHFKHQTQVTVVSISISISLYMYFYRALLQLCETSSKELVTGRVKCLLYLPCS